VKIIDRKVYCFWTGRNPLSQNRLDGLESMRKNIGVPIEFLDWHGWYRMILPNAPLHQGFQYLSCVHKAGYLRCYFMHHFGGGYADIKHYTTQNNWGQCFSILNTFPKIEVIGQPEIMDGSPIKDFNHTHIIPKLISNGFFICRDHTDFTTAWYNRLMERMDYYLPHLREHPATMPYGGDGYPVPWAALLGEIVHLTVMEERDKNPEAVCSALQTGWDNTKDYR